MIKSNEAYKSISEVAELLNLINPKTGKISTHTLRFWEKNFKQIKPKILSGNRRYYSNKDINFLKIVHELLKKQRFTIEGAKRALNTQTFKLDDTVDESIKNKNFKASLKKRASKIKLILNKIKTNK